MKNYMGLILLVSIAGCMTLPEPPQVEKQDPRISQSHLEMSF
jgi:hypothetical protein